MNDIYKGHKFIKTSNYIFSCDYHCKICNLKVKRDVSHFKEYIENINTDINVYFTHVTSDQYYLYCYETLPTCNDLIIKEIIE